MTLRRLVGGLGILLELVAAFRWTAVHGVDLLPLGIALIAVVLIFPSGP